VLYFIVMSGTDTFPDSSSGVLDESLAEFPPERNVVFYNDDVTPMDFVVKLLVSVFNKSPSDAETIMMRVHENGTEIAGRYTYDIAVSRADLAVKISRKNGFPLRIEVE